MRAALASLLHRLAEHLDPPYRSEPSSRPPGSEQHPAGRPRLAVVPAGIAQGRADLQLTHDTDAFWRAAAAGRLRRGHGASEGDPDL